MIIREFKQIATAGATTAAVTEKVWGEYASAVCQIYKLRCEKHELRSLKSLLFSSLSPNGFAQKSDGRYSPC